MVVPSNTYQLHRSVMVLLALAYLPGCTTWKTQDVAPVQSLKQPVPPRLRVQLNDGRTVFLTSARVENDSLVGVVRGEDVPGRTAGRTAVALSEVARTEARGAKTLATLGVVGGVVAIGTLYALAQAYGSNY